MTRSTRIAAIAASAVVGLPAAATAHVTLQPAQAPAGGFARLDVRVPTERDDAATRKVQVKFPPGFIFVSHEPVAGWETKVRMVELEKPVEVFGEQRTEQVDTVTFTARGKGIGPGEFQDFGLSVGLPDTPGRSLTFKAVQTYTGGEVVRWIGAPDADHPAPRVTLTAPEATAPTAAVAAAAPGAAGDEDEGGSDALAIVALIVGGLGLAAGSAGLATARRARSSAAA